MFPVPYEYFAVVVGVVISMLFGYFVVAVRARNLICDALGITKVQTKTGPIFTMDGPDGEPVKVPIGVKEGKDGAQEVVMGYAPLLYTMAWQITNDSAFKVSQALGGIKSGIARRMKGAAIEGVASGEMGFEALAPFLPKKALAAIAVIKTLGAALGGQQSQGQEIIINRSHRGGGGPI